MRKFVFVVTSAIVCYACAMLGFIVLFSAVGGTTQAEACALLTSRSGASLELERANTTTRVANADCGAAAPVTLPTAAIVNNGLPTDYVIPMNSTAVETVAITYALAQLGKPYLWGGDGPNAFDCSGLTMMAWAEAGVTLLHYTGDQINEGTPVSSNADISPGDLVLVPGSDGTIVNPGHVGLYIGDGLVESAVDVQYGVIVQPYSYFVSGGLSGIRHVG